MTPHQLAAHIWEQATSQGLDAPTEGMIAEAINDAMDNAFDACVNELRGHGFNLSADSLERLRARMHDGEKVLFARR